MERKVVNGITILGDRYMVIDERQVTSFKKPGVKTIGHYRDMQEHIEARRKGKPAEGTAAAARRVKQMAKLKEKRGE